MGSQKAGIYIVTVTANGCSLTATTLVVVDKKPKITNVLRTCTGNKATVKITAQSQPQSNGLEYSLNGGSSYQSSKTFTNVSNGTYTVVVRDLVTGCTQSMSITISCGNTKTEEIRPTVLQVAPNPFDTETNIFFQTEEADRATVKVYGLDGEEVATLFDAETESGVSYHLTFDGNRLPTGVYILYLITNSGIVEQQKLVISR